MTSVRALDDAKRGYPTRVGPLAKLILRHKMQAVVHFTGDERAAMREALLTRLERVSSDALGEQVAALNGVDGLTPGQMVLLRSRVRR